MATASMVLGIIALLSCIIPGLGLITAIIALIVAIIAMSNKNTKGKDNGAKTAGLVLSIIAAIVSFTMTSILVSAFTLVLDVASGITDATEQIYENPEAEELVSELYGEYFGIVLYNKFSREDITVEEAKTMYMDVLMNEHRDLYNEGYDIHVDEDLKFELITPEEIKI